MGPARWLEGMEVEPPGSANGATTCEGSTVVVCDAGRIDRVACLSLGFSCEVDRSMGKYGCVPRPMP